MYYLRTCAILSLIILMMLCGAFIPRDEPEFKNLKVLPKNISHDELEKVMDGFKLALGVKCNFCHAARKDDPNKLDFPSDENPHKNVARSMIRMTKKINRKYFGKVKSNGTLVQISCISCHNGKEHPAVTKIKKEI